MDNLSTIDFTTEEVFSLVEAAKMLPRRRMGKKPNVATLYRWSLHGMKGIRLDDPDRRDPVHIRGGAPALL